MEETISHSFPNCLDSKCPFYPRIQSMCTSAYLAGPHMHFGDGIPPTSEDYQTIFHEICDDCALADTDEQNLCNFCQHLRIRHLVLCVAKRGETRIPYIYLGPVNELSQRPNCSFCGMISSMHSTRVDPDGPELLLFPLPIGQTIQGQEYNPDPPGFVFQLASIPERMCLTRMFAEVRDCLQPSPQGNCSNSLSSYHLTEKSVNWERLRQWMASCTLTHDHTPRELEGCNTGLPRGFRLIDVGQQCVVSAPAAPNFMALSYVWGRMRPGEIEHRMSNSEELGQTNALRSEGIPRTITDAMIVCKELGVPYLWVDRLCIVQDDAAQKHSQIQAMHSIYSLACLTVCAIAGDSAHWGLPGVGKSERALHRKNVKLQNLAIAPVLPGLNDCLHHGKWHQRGWTFQEAILSRRLLIFTETQVFWKCGEKSIPEDPLTAKGSLGLCYILFDEKTEAEQVRRLYQMCLSQYTHRQLSFDSDIFNAFAGVLRKFYPDIKETLYGLSKREFDLSILWLEADRKPQWKDSLPPPQKSGTQGEIMPPTWSWASSTICGVSHMGPASLMCGAVATWIYQDDKGFPSRIRAIGRPKDTWNTQEFDNEKAQWARGFNPEYIRTFLGLKYRPEISPHGAREYILAAWEYCIEAPLPENTQVGSPSIPSQQQLQELWPTYEQFWIEAHGRRHVPIPRAFASLSKPGRLLVRTSVIRGKIFRNQRVRPVPNGRLECYLLDKSGKSLGICFLPKPSTAETYMKNTRSGVEGWDVSLLALSVMMGDMFLMERVQKGDVDCQPRNLYGSAQARPPRKRRRTSAITSADGRDFTLTDGQGNLILPPPSLSVMVVGWRGPVAYRICLGRVLLARWKVCSPAFKTIVLE